jgi:plastocyanin domain-containing protein
MNTGVWARSALFFAALSLLAACDKGSGASAASSAKADDKPAAASTVPLPPGARRVEVTASKEGYTPSSIDMKKGETVVLRFTRKTKSECLSLVRIPKLNVTKELPVGEPVDVVVKADEAGDIGFQCGMNMVKGTIHVSGS